MQCNTSYTLDESNLDYANLNVIDSYRKEFPNSIIGLSCHLKDDLSVLIAVSKKAAVHAKVDDNFCNGIIVTFSAYKLNFSVY